MTGDGETGTPAEGAADGSGAPAPVPAGSDTVEPASSRGGASGVTISHPTKKPLRMERLVSVAMTAASGGYSSITRISSTRMVI